MTVVPRGVVAATLLLAALPAGHALRCQGRPAGRAACLHTRCYTRPTSRDVALWAAPPDPTVPRGESEGSGSAEAFADRRALAEAMRPWYLVLVLGLPLLAQGFAPLLDALLVGPDAPTYRFRPELLTVLLVGKRAFLYSMSFVIVAISAQRASADSPQFGSRTKDLTNEVFYIFSDLSDDSNPEDARTQQLEQLQTTLNEVNGGQQAALLPVVVASSLAFSVLLLQLPTLLQQGSLVVGDAGVDFGLAVAEAVESSVKASNALVCVLFTRAELAMALLACGVGGAVQDDESTCVLATPPAPCPQRHLKQNPEFWGPSRRFPPSDLQSKPNTVQSVPTGTKNSGLCLRACVWPWGAVAAHVDTMASVQAQLVWSSLALSTGLVAAAFLGPSAVVWPAQNLICMSIAITVARAVQLPSLPLVLGVLLALVGYDVVGVLGAQVGSVLGGSGAAGSTAATQAAAATAATTTAGVGASGSSAMAAVALAKVNPGGGWQPGVLEVLLRGRVSDLLGLGDAVFPALLATWAARFDAGGAGVGPASNSNPRGFATAALAGYVAGLVACEAFYSESAPGQPALVFIVPCMAAVVLGWAGVRGELGEACTFDGEASGIAPSDGDEGE